MNTDGGSLYLFPGHGGERMDKTQPVKKPEDRMLEKALP